jgi:hypothetical protein
LRIFIYYRLKQTDYDGKFTYSNNLVANCFDEKISIEPKLYPNPNKGVFYIENNYPIEINIYSSLGELVFSQEMLNQGKQQLNLSHLSEGVYSIVMKYSDKFFSQKIVIQH